MSPVSLVFYTVVTVIIGLKTQLGSILTVSTVWNTGKTGDIKSVFY